MYTAWGTLHANKRIKIVIYAERTLYPGEEVGDPFGINANGEFDG